MLFTFRNVLTGIVIFCALSEVLAIMPSLSPTVASRNPMGWYGAISYLQHFGSDETRESFAKEARRRAQSMNISADSCPQTIAYLRRVGGVEGMKNLNFESRMNAYDRSRTVWPVAYALMFLVLLFSIIASAKAHRAEPKSLQEFDDRRIQEFRQERFNSLSKKRLR